MCKLIDNRLLEELSSNVLRPLARFLNFYGKSVDWFIQQIDDGNEEGNSVAIQMIDDFAQYGMFYILVPLNEAISTYMPTEFFETWKKQWDNLKYNSTIIHSIAAAFHAQLIEESQNEYIGGELTKVVKYVRGCGLHKKIWKSYPDSFWQYPQENSDIYLGMLIPGIYSVGLEQRYMDAVYDHAIPQLLLLKRHINKFPTNKILQAVICETVLCYSSELGYQYYTLTSVATKIISNSKLYENDEEYARFFENEVLKQSNFQLNMTSERVEILEKLGYCVEQFGFVQPSCRSLLYFIPVAQQLVGKIQEASKKLIALHNQVDVNDKTTHLFLIAYYRMWIRETGIAKQQASVILNGLNAGGLEDALRVYHDIADFYKQFCTEFAKRFDRKGIDALKAHSSEEDARFYWMWKKLYSNDIKNKWFFETFVKSNLLSQLFSFLLQKCESEQTDANKTLSWMYFMDSLFNPLISHLHISNALHYELLSTLRINVDGLVRACNDIILHQGLNFSQISIPQFQEQKGCIELFKIYSPSQIEVLIQLDTRIREVYRNRPKQLPKDMAQTILNATSPSSGCHRATWEAFNYFNGDKHEQFELLCRDLFRKIYFDGKTDVLFHSNPNNCGIEICPILCSKTSKRMSFQAKYFFNSKTNYIKFLESAKKTAEVYQGKLDLVILYCNKDINLQSRSYANIVDILGKANIEVKTVCNQTILDLVDSDKALVQKYFEGHSSGTV